ncbi:protein RAE1-like isoform X2 [Prunus dulcis]|uniref:protein RAE1-like isoform X2 n=1 Tax=Prunus dulcis TaxID=3755 RepID=UPI0014834A12|nr:protein RAE1-like isoform X2 [Prunus dulcis]
MSKFMAAPNANANSTSNPNPNNSFEVAQPPNDSISSLSFSPKSNILVATSWDNQVRCWEIQQSGTNLVSQPQAAISHDHPVLCSTWKEDGTTVFSGGCDKQVKMWPLGGQPVTVAVHDAPIKEIAWIPEMSLLVTGSLDKTMKYWDVRQPNPVHTQQLPERCYALSVRYPLMVVGTADRNLIVFNLQNPQTEFKRILSPLKYQTRCVAAFPDQQGFLVHHTLTTAGSDGSFTFWDKDSKQRLKEMSRCNQPIPCSTFNNDGSIFAYAVCYDWGKGAEKHNPATAKNHIFLHVPQEAEVKRKPRVNTGGKR